jgi:hypothetical protein
MKSPIKAFFKIDGNIFLKKYKISLTVEEEGKGPKNLASLSSFLLASKIRGNSSFVIFPFFHTLTVFVSSLRVSTLITLFCKEK